MPTPFPPSNEIRDQLRAAILSGPCPEPSVTDLLISLSQTTGGIRVFHEMYHVFMEFYVADNEELADRCRDVLDHYYNWPPPKLGYLLGNLDPSTLIGAVTSQYPDRP
jgi:hypothetical protein